MKNPSREIPLIGDFGAQAQASGGIALMRKRGDG
jgi:hypothetical protein